jgi:hypothetical protein
MLYQRDGGVDVSMDCPKNLIVATDCLRLKLDHAQPWLQFNKFVHPVLFRFPEQVVDGVVEVYVEDSGPGIPIKKARSSLKSSSSLDVLSHGPVLTEPMRI